MPLYESVFIVRQDITATQVDSLTDDFAKIVEDNGGAIGRREYWGLRTLSYRIKKNRKGHYVLFNLDAPAACVQEMERNMRLNEDILRYMTIRVEEAREEPSPIMQGKGDRERERADRSSRHGGGRPRGDRPAPTGDRAPAEAPKPAEAQKAAEETKPAETPAAAEDAAAAPDKPAETTTQET